MIAGETGTLRQRKNIPMDSSTLLQHLDSSQELLNEHDEQGDSSDMTISHPLAQGGDQNSNNNVVLKKQNSESKTKSGVEGLYNNGFTNDGFDEEDVSETERLMSHESGSEEEARVEIVETPVSVPQERSWQIMLQVFFPYIVAGFGMVAAGMLLDVVQHWPVFELVPEVFILVPALLGLKGNLEMTLASRLSTQANMGNLDKKGEQWKMIAGNLALTQVQAIVVGFLASVAAMVFGWIPKGKFDINHGVLLCASSVLTAAFASFVLGSVMICVVLISHKCRINPDNVATPIAASLGDLTTLALLSGVSSMLHKVLYTQTWLSPLLLVIFLGLTPLWCVVSHRNKYVNEVLYEGWTPVIGAMVISSMGGLILDFAVVNYKGLAVFQPVINAILWLLLVLGVGGNLVAVQASRLSTALHCTAKLGSLPPSAPKNCPNPCSTFFSSGQSARTARVLMLLVIPGHLIFTYTIHFMQAGHTTITLVFLGIYLLAAVIQVAILLYVANWLVHWLWVRENDPDNFSIPYLTALGDLLGTGLLAITFKILYVPLFNDI